MPDLVISAATLAEIQNTLRTNADSLKNLDQAIRGLDVAVVGADPFVQRLGDLHEALASAIWMLGEALTSTLDFVNTTDTAFGEVDRELAHGHRLAPQ